MIDASLFLSLSLSLSLNLSLSLWRLSGAAAVWSAAHTMTAADGINTNAIISDGSMVAKWSNFLNLNHVCALLFINITFANKSQEKGTFVRVFLTLGVIASPKRHSESRLIGQ
jgi:hypothetical protein